MVEIAKAENYPKFLAEFCGTFILVSTVVFSVYANAGVFTATAIACSLMVAVYAFGSVSGAHLNPAVSAAIWWGGQLQSVELMVCYWLFQILGGVAAGLTGMAVYGDASNKLIEPSASATLQSAVCGEFLYTFMLAFVVLNCACTKSAVGNQYYGLAIGFVIVAGGYAWGGISGGAFNPAVLLGFNLGSHALGDNLGKRFAEMAIYIVFELLGGVCAAALWKMIRAEDFGGQKNTLWARCMSEFIGAFFLCFTVCACVITGSASTPWSAAAALMCMIYAVGNVSGAHLNPAVTLAVLLSGRHKISVKDACYYWLSQFFAGGVAGGVAYGILGGSGKIGPVANFTWPSVFVAEAVYTAVLCFTVLSCLTMKPAEWTKDFFGLAIASCVTLGGFAAGGVSGGALNPAVALSVDFGSLLHGKGFANCLAYAGFEFVGAALATGVFWVTRPEEYQAARKQYDSGKA